MSITENQANNIGEHKSSISSGMWLLLFLELVVFGGFFISFFVFRRMYTADFLTASRQLNSLLGTLNIILLLTSSLTVVLSAASLEGKRTSLAVFFQLTTVLFGLFFLVNKYYEFAVKEAGRTKRVLLVILSGFRYAYPDGSYGCRCGELEDGIDIERPHHWRNRPGR